MDVGVVRVFRLGTRVNWSIRIIWPERNTIFGDQLVCLVSCQIRLLLAGVEDKWPSFFQSWMEGIVWCGKCSRRFVLGRIGFQTLLPWEVNQRWTRYRFYFVAEVFYVVSPCFIKKRQKYVYADSSPPYETVQPQPYRYLQ
jgi:hypothetical protein